MAHRLIPRCILPLLLLSALTAPAVLIDRWLADDLDYLNDGDSVGSWTSLSNRTVAGASGFQPALRKSMTPVGGSVVRFNRHWLTTSSTPFGGATAFSIAIVFKASAPGANDAAQWYGKSGIVDAEQGGATADWGTVLDEQGRVAIGSGGPDTTTFSTLPSLVDSNYHVAVFTWGGGTQRVYVDRRAVSSASGVSAGARNANAGFSFGGILTGENGAVRRFVGDLVEVRFYNNALTGTEATNVITELTDTHINVNIPRIFSFTANTNQIYLGGSATLSWNVTNASSIEIDNNVGPVAIPTGSVAVSPTNTTTYTLTATNAFGRRTAITTVIVDPGVPIAFNLSTNTVRNTPVSFRVSAFDPNGGTLVYSIDTPPAHGALSGTLPDVTYSPDPGFEGTDNFTFKVNDGMFDSAAATVSIKVIPPPTPPTGIVLSTTNISASAHPGSFIAGLHTIDVNEFDTHTYALVAGFGDNSKFIITGNQLLAGPSFSGGVGATFSIRLRTTDNTGFSYEQSFPLRGVAATESIVINEAHYNPPFNPVREEFVELYNNTDAPLDLSGWRLRGGVDFFIPSGTVIPARGFVVIAESPATIQSRYGVAALGPWSGNLSGEGEQLRLDDSNGDAIDEVNYRSEFPWPILANGDGPSMQLVNPNLDNDLGSSWRSGLPVTPGATNAVFAVNAAPNIRQVNHSPQMPASTNTVLVTAKITDPEGVASVQLLMQVVRPGSFIPATLPLNRAQLDSLTTNVFLTNSLNPAFEADTNWTTVAMNDDGVNGDAVAGDNIYSVVLPQQANRTLVRYRITSTDTLGLSRRAPFEDDPSLNFAYFVYDGIPAYQNHSAAVLRTLPIYTLITRAGDMDQCAAWFSANDQIPQNFNNGALRNEGRLHFNWEGAMVYDGQVYDHITFRLRGANGRYHNGKRSFRFRFQPGHLLEAKDQSGERFPTKWRELTTGKGQSNRGSETFALNEVLNYFLWNKVGVPAPSTFHFHFRVIRGAQESPTDKYAGDFWGLAWAQEKYDVNFLDSHNLPKGNLYKLVDNFVLGVDERRYQASLGPTNAADFFNIENNLTGFQTTDWLNAYANYTNWYRYFTVAEAIRHYDIWPSANKNGAWYFEPIYSLANSNFGRMMQLPYDSTDTWGPTWNNGEDILFNGIFASGATGGDPGQNPEMQKEYRNVARELRDLLFQPDQINPLIDAFVARLRDFAPADHLRWSNAPAPANYLSLGIPSSPGVSGGLLGAAQDMKNFMFTGGSYSWWVDRNTVSAGGWITRLDTVATDAAIPSRPTVTYAGSNGIPINNLIFRSSAFADPQGADTIASMQWRVAEITPPGTPVSNPSDLKLEWDAAWDSGEIPGFNEYITLPAAQLLPDHLYRVRVRHKDNTGRWSRWSPAFEFRPTRIDLVSALRTNLVFSEIMYNPPGAGATDGDEFEFVELKNIGTSPLDLGGLFFSSGINFTFTNGTTLAPGQLFLLGRNAAALQTRYPGLIVNGVYTGKLDNGGETISISHPHAGVILSVTYNDRAPWPVAADGFGFSLVLADPVSRTYGASAQPFGNPGVDGGLSAIGGVVINELLSASLFPSLDRVELYNLTTNNIDIGGWYLTDDPTFPWKFRIPDGTIIPRRNYELFSETNFNPTPGLGNSFSFSSVGDQVYLFSGDASSQLTGYSHGFSFGGAPEGVSFVRYLNSIGEEFFPLGRFTSFNDNNAGPRIGPVIISEIHYHPRAPIDEFLELRNFAGTNVALYDPAFPTNVWVLNGLGYTFPAGTVMAGNSRLLLVSDDPAVFRARHNVSAQVPILQYVGALQDDGENLELLAPATPTTNGVPYYIVDAVRYNDRSPWPLAADGAGASLQRSQANISGDETRIFGNDPASWFAALPTPGTAVGAVLSGFPQITAQPHSRTNVAYTDVSFSVTATGVAPLYYQWRFENSNIDGATNSTLLLPNVQLSQAGNYSVVVFNSIRSAESDSAALALLVPPTITQQPTNLLVRIRPDPQAAATTNATFCVTASTFNPPLTYQWRFNGANIPGETNSCVTIVNVQLANEGAYSVVVTDTIGSTTSQDATLTPLITPVVVQGPLSQGVLPDTPVTLSIEVTGHPLPFTFEWRRSTTPIVTNVVYGPSNFFTFTAPSSVGVTQQFRVIIKNLANSAPGVATSFANVWTLLDSDFDEIPDDWEIFYGFNPDSGEDRDFDADLDGTTNLEEYRAGTDPTNSLSGFRLQISADLPRTISFGASSNHTYSVEFAGDMAGPWTRLADFVARATNRLEAIVDPGSTTTNRYYRAVTPRQAPP
jgi:hypothetical protein